MAAEAAQAFRKLAELRDSLPKYQIDRNASEIELTSLLSALDEFLTLVDTNLELALALIGDDKADRLAMFIALCEKCALIEHELTSILAAGLNDTTLANLNRVWSICDENDIKTLDWTKLQSDLTDKREMLQVSANLSAIIAPFIKIKPDAAAWNLAAMGKAAQAIMTAGREALLCRNTATNDPSALPLLKNLIAEGRDLQTERNELSKQVTLSVDASSETLASAVAVLRAGGLFAVFSGNYRNAMRLARSLSLAERFEKRDALNHLEKLTDFRRREHAFLQNPQAAALFGRHFKGVDTDFTPFEKLADYYEQIQSALNGFEFRALRSFLGDAELDELEAVPAIPVDTSASTLATLRKDIAEANRRIAIAETALDELQQLLSLFHAPASVAPGTLPGLSEKLIMFLGHQAELEADHEITALLGKRFAGSRTQVEPLKSICAWAQAAEPVATPLSRILRDSNPAEAAKQINLVLQAQARADILMDKLSDVAKIEPYTFTNGNGAAATALALEAAANDADGLFVHSALATELTELEETGTLPLVKHQIASGIPIGLSLQLEALAARQLARAAYAEYGTQLSRFPGSRLDDLRSALARQDKKIIKLAQKQLRWKIHAETKPPYGHGIGKKSTWTEMALIDNEINKQQRFISVRDLTQRAGKALLELKPCWMMSPLAVAQYVPKDALVFNLFITDEASQMPPEAAIGALLRCKQTVVVGDTKQLPPSSFFKKMIDEDEADEDDTVLNESILEMANATFRPVRRLR